MGTTHPTRRGLAGAGLLAALGVAARPVLAATPVPEAAILLSPGPEDGPEARMAGRAAAALARGLVQASALRVTVLGGPDGITAANRFASSTAPDGRVLLLLPGLAAQAQLVGDSRARYEPRQWPALCASLQAAVVAGRGAPADGTPLRVALPGPAAPEAAALLALDLLGRRAAPVFGLSGAAAEAAVSQGQVDALVLCGGAPGPRAAALGLTPWFAFDAAGGGRDALAPEIPSLGDLIPDPHRPDLLEAARAAGAAMRTRALVVLPQLTSADVVALWRGAAQRWAEEPADEGARRVGAAEATMLSSTLCAAPDIALAYREWLLRRLNWRAG
ncbi:hypothetical protein G3576_14925 [Roseomonas stagni]|uniref:Tripartite tricarboxylate transporter substrate binding protein n=1 Tax=Falsiroseomonas algicola TaxID=2716930 RepID=A0A6M1LNF0_9PROT|nr:hypothetical protein [Falsiroseomonas algicola]NGM21314.1 hypothetical protein [Falsiroseomonas algicola]